MSILLGGEVHRFALALQAAAYSGVKRPMKDDISQRASSAYHAIELMKQQALDEAKLDKKAKQSSVKLESLLDEQTKLLKEANERAARWKKSRGFGERSESGKASRSLGKYHCCSRFGGYSTSILVGKLASF